jgi:hypothetical protein
VSTSETLLEQGPCKVCNATVVVEIRRDGGIPVTADGYTGLTDDGDDYVCRDHYCPACGGYHTNAAAFDRCAHYGVDEVDMTPPCSVEAAYAVLGATA